MPLTLKSACKFAWAHKHTVEYIYKINQLAQLLNVCQKASQLQLVEFYIVLCIVKHLLLPIQKAQKADFLKILNKLHKVHTENVVYTLLDNKENLAITT